MCNDQNSKANLHGNKFDFAFAVVEIFVDNDSNFPRALDHNFLDEHKYFGSLVDMADSTIMNWMVSDGVDTVIVLKWIDT